MQSTIVSVSSSELAPPTPFPQASVCPPPLLDPGEGYTLACGGGGGGSQFR
jgi:hypothetical protein